jgi:hypothetical protein
MGIKRNTDWYDAPEGMEWTFVLTGTDVVAELRPLSERYEAEERARKVIAERAEKARLARIEWEKDMEDYW